MGFFDRFKSPTQISITSIPVATQPSILLPLYIYPHDGAWDPLYHAITAHSALQFILVINPASGPGSSPSPDLNYERELLRLNTYSNVRLVGYISSQWGKRSFSDIVREVRCYRGWREDIGLQGIFLDETPTEWSKEVEEFLRGVNGIVRGALSGFGNGALMIHNPGAIPDSRLLGPNGPDIIVAVEATFATVQRSNILKSIASLKIDTTKLASMIHSLPPLNSRERAKFVKELKQVTGHVFITELFEDVYSSWGNVWNGFVEEMDN